MSQDCFLNSKDGKNFSWSRGLSGLVRLSECNDEVKHHLISCHLSKEVLSEYELILARTGLFHLAQEDEQIKVLCEQTSELTDDLHDLQDTRIILPTDFFLHSVNQKFHYLLRLSC